MLFQGFLYAKGSVEYEPCGLYEISGRRGQKGGRLYQSQPHGRSGYCQRRADHQQRLSSPVRRVSCGEERYLKLRRNGGRRRDVRYAGTLLSLWQDASLRGSYHRKRHPESIYRRYGSKSAGPWEGRGKIKKTRDRSGYRDL